MSNNSFLSNYNNNVGNTAEPASEVVVKDVDLGYKYEEKSGFRKPEYTGGSDLPPFRRPKLLVPIIVGAAVVVGVVILLLVLLNGGIAVIDFKGMTLDQAALWANENGVMLKTVEEFNDKVAANSIISQDIEEGKTVKKGEFLTLTVSRGHDMSVTLKVPEIMNMTADEIQAWADANYLSKLRITTEFSETVPLGKVIRFTINDNTVVSEIRRDTPVYVIISKGVEDESTIQVTVPNFKSMTISEAYIFANENGLVLTVTDQYDDYVSKGSVISQSVKADEKISRGSEIKLVVSKGKMIEVPDFSDYTKEQAGTVASGLGISVTVIEKYSSSSAGSFLSQSIPAGSIYEDGDFLELTYSLGNITVPSFIGQKLEEIKDWENQVDKLGARITISKTTTKSNEPKGTIIYQDKANTTVKVGTTIYITVSDGKIVYVPDFVDDTTISPTRGYDTAITREEAMKICEAAGLIAVLEKGDEDDDAADMAGRLPGEIWWQGSEPFTEAAEGKKITLKYVPYKTTDTYKLDENFVGQSEGAILANDEYRINLNIVFEGEGSVVVKQSIALNTTVVRGTIIILTLGEP